MKILISPELRNLFEKNITSTEVLSKLWQEANDKVKKQKIAELQQAQEKLRARYSFD